MRPEAAETQPGERSPDGETDSAPERKRAPRDADSHTPIWEWIVAAVGALLLLGAIGLLIYEEFTGDESPPAVVVEVDSVVEVGDRYLVTIRAINRGDSAGAGVAVEGQLRDGDRTIETSAITLDHLPPRSEYSAGLFFGNDPRAFELHLQAKGYSDP